MTKSSGIPKLDTVHSGVPDRLLKEADEAKERLYSLRTLPNSTPRQSSLRLPPDVSRVDFDKAIAELKTALGDKGVDLNDKPLVDGCYMEHP